MRYQTKLTDTLNPKKLKTCELKFLSITYFGTPCGTKRPAGLGHDNLVFLFYFSCISEVSVNSNVIPIPGVDLGL